MGLAPTQPAVTMGGQAAAMPAGHSPCTTVFPVLSVALRLEPHLGEGCPLTCLCPADERISPVPIFVLHTASLPPSILSVGNAMSPPSLCLGPSWRGRVVFVKMRDRKGGLEPTGHFTERIWMDSFVSLFPNSEPGSVRNRWFWAGVGDGAC